MIPVSTTTRKVLALLADGIPRDIADIVAATGIAEILIENALRNLNKHEWMKKAPARYTITTPGLKKLASEEMRDLSIKAALDLDARRAIARRNLRERRERLAADLAGRAMKQVYELGVARPKSERMPKGTRSRAEAMLPSGESILESARRQPNSVFALGGQA